MHFKAKQPAAALWLLLAILASESRTCSARVPSSLGLQTRTQDCPIGQEARAGDRDFFLSGRAAAAELFGGNFSCGTAAWGPRKCMDSGQAAAGPGSQQDGAIRDEARGAAAGAQASGDNNREREVPETKDPETQTEEAAAEDRQEISCKDHNGANVDWFFAIKLSQSERLIYVASNGAAERRWIQVDDVWNASPVSNTFHQVQDRELFLYNDHPPGQAPRTSGAHMKGVILQGPSIGDSGFWMLHSVPQFPNVTWSNIDGQSFFCVTLNWLEIEIVNNLVHDLSTDFPNIFNYRNEILEYQTLQTPNSVSLYINAKLRLQTKEVYDMIKGDGRYLRNVRVQSYRLGTSPPLPHTNARQNVNAAYFSIENDEAIGMLFSQDNSKWSIGEIPVAGGESRKFFCAGDLDRVEAHLRRSGCLVCMENPRLWRLLDAAIRLGEQLNNQGHQPPPELPNAGTCKISENQPVDWFIVVKNKGVHAYRYLSSRNGADWQTYNRDVNSPLYWTLREANAAGPESKYFYNDQHDRLNTNVHAKGVVVVGDVSGFWLMHSMPNFPVLTLQGKVGEDFWPKIDGEDNVRYGQIFLCFTFKRAEAEKIKTQIRVLEKLPIYDNVANFEVFPKTIKFHSTRLVSFGGVEFVHIAKNSDYRVDVYETVSNLIGSRLHVQCFTGGGGGNLSRTHRISQISKTEFRGWAAMLAGSDHSKWCVAQNANLPYFCIGDLNRKESQLKRGGGVLCLLNRNVRQKFSAAFIR